MKYAPLVFGFILWIPTASANDVVGCDPTHPLVPNAVTRFERAVNFPETTGFLVWIAPNNSMTPSKQATMNQLRAQFDSLLAVPFRYWICTDTTPVDGTLDGVREMTPAEKTTLDAPTVAEQQRRQAFETERTTNTVCNAELATIDARIDQLIDSATTIPQVKAAIKVALKRVARCVIASQ